MSRKRKDDNSTTAKAILGLLSMAPMSGYDIRALIDRSIGFFWQESYGQIYPALKKLTADGLVKKKTEQTKGRPVRHLYSLTPAGHDHMAQWLEIPATPEIYRNEMLLKLFFGSNASVPTSRGQVEIFLERHKAALATYEAVGRRLRKESEADPSLPYWLMTLSYGKHNSEAMVSWAEETIKQLDKLERRAKEKSDARK